MARGKGGRKVAIEKISKQSNLQVTFSKRKYGIFKKASELCTLCGSEIAIVMFSPAKKVFSFGHPFAETVVDRFLSGIPPQHSDTIQLIEAYRNATILELIMHLTQILHQLETEKKRGEELNEIRKVSQSECWWEAPVEELSLPQLDQLKDSLEELKKNVATQAQKLTIQSTTPPKFLMGCSSTGGGLPFNSNLTPAHFFVGSFSTGEGNPNSTPSPYFKGSSSMGGTLPFDPNPTGFNQNEMPCGLNNPRTEYNNQGYDNLGFGRGFY